MRISLVSSIVAALVLPSIVLGQGQSVYSSYGSAYYDVAVENDGVTLSGYDVLDSGMSGPSFCHHNYSLSFYFGDEQGNTVGSGNSLYRTSPANQGVAMRVDASVATNASTNYYAYPSANAFCDCANQTFIATDWNRVAAGFTAVQHSYPRNPLDKVCRISSFFDAVRAAGAHHAEDVIYDNGNGGGTRPPYGTPVSAMEAGRVVAAPRGYSPAPYPACLSGNPRPQGNYAKIIGADGYYTIYFHMMPSVSTGQLVVAGQVIGVLDSSGCQSGAHLHVGRKDPNNNNVNFTIPCTNQLPTNQFFDGLVDDAVPDNL